MQQHCSVYKKQGFIQSLKKLGIPPVLNYVTYNLTECCMISLYFIQCQVPLPVFYYHVFFLCFFLFLKQWLVQLDTLSLNVVVYSYSCLSSLLRKILAVSDLYFCYLVDHHIMYSFQFPWEMLLLCWTPCSVLVYRLLWRVVTVACEESIIL